MTDQLGLLDLINAGTTAMTQPEVEAAAAKACDASRRRQLDVDARRQCPVCHAAPGQPCYQHCEANRPG